MKYVFLVCLIVLVAASFITQAFMPDTRTAVPVLYWVTDNNPARAQQIKLFQAFLKKNHYPEFELRLDTANADWSKKIIQGVSGVAGDIMDVMGDDLAYFHDIGLLDDVTDDGKKMGFDPDHTYPAVRPRITVNGRQYLFPCNAFGGLYFVNKATFKKYDLTPPSGRWTIEQFEQQGKAFVAAANASGQRQRVFFADTVDVEILRRGLGLSMFNETGTASTLDDPRNVRALKTIYQWTYQDRLLPTNADMQSFSTNVGYAGASPQLFNSGTFGMLLGGRHILIQLRQFGAPLDLGVAEQPHGGFPTMLVGTRAAGIYAGGKHKDLARYFLAFLASQDYNMNIVDDADGQPPNPAFATTEEYLRPTKYPNESECHQGFANAINTIGCVYSSSPFVLNNVASRIQTNHYNAVMSNIESPETAAAAGKREIDTEIQRTLQEQPELRPRYEELCARQKKIEQMRAEGKKVPESWIEDPFLKQYYAHMGWSTKEESR